MSKIIRDIEAIKRLSRKVLLDLKRRRLSKAKKHLNSIIAFDTDELTRLQREDGGQSVINECLIVLKQAKRALKDISDFNNLKEAKILVQKIGAIEDKELSTIRLRAHHVGKIEQFHLSPELFELSDAEYLAQVKEDLKKAGYPDSTYSDEWILEMRKIFRRMFDDPTIKFEYVTGPDSLCALCHHRKKCVNLNHDFHRIVNQADFSEAARYSFLKKRKTYGVKYLLRIYKKKGWFK